MDRRIRSEKVIAAFRKKRSLRQAGRLERVRNGKRLVFRSEPEYIRNSAGEIIGVDAWVELYDEHGNEIPIDPHRRIINPPTVPRSNLIERETPDGFKYLEVGDEDPYEAFIEAVWDSVDATPYPQGWRTAGTVTTVYGDTSDGRLEGQGATYTVARNGTGTIQIDTTGAAAATGQFYSSTYSCYQQFWAFDTSAITDSDEVTGVTLELYQTGQNLAGGNFTVEAREFNWGASLTTADYRAGNTLANYTLLATIETSGMGTLNRYYALKSTSAFLSVSNLKTGVVRLFTSSSKQRTGTAPTAREFVQFATANASGTTTDPKLTITHYTQGTVVYEDFEDTNYAVTLSGNWSRNSSTSHSGSWSWKSATISHNQRSEGHVTLPPGAQTVQFWYKVSSEQDFDTFRFYIGGNRQLNVSGEVDWTQSPVYNVGSATSITFQYNKDVSFSDGQDAAWIDDLVITVIPLEHHSGGSSTSTSHTTSGSGRPGFRNGSGTTTSHTSAGSGSPGFSGGAGTSLTVTDSGNGAPGFSEGSLSEVAITVAGDGSPTFQEGSEATVTITASGGGQASEQASGGSTAIVEVTATGDGEIAVSGGSGAVVETVVTGGGIRVIVDISVTVGPTIVRSHYLVGESRSSVSVESNRLSASAENTRNRDLVMVGGSAVRDRFLVDGSRQSVEVGENRLGKRVEPSRISRSD